MRRSLQGTLWLDTELEDGYLYVEAGRFPRIFMSAGTHQALSWHESALDRLWDLVDSGRAPEGTFLLPRAVVEPDAAEDLRRGLSIVDVEPSEVCVYPPCSLTATTTHADGFRLCDEHDALMRGWDDLLVG